MTAAGQLIERLRFEIRSADEDGDRTGPGWDVLFTARAEIVYLHGTEVVQAARLEGDQPVVFTLHSSRASRALTPACRAVDTRDESQVYDIKSIEPKDGRRQWLQVLAVKRSGGTVG